MWLGEKPRWEHDERNYGWYDAIGKNYHIEVDCSFGTGMLDAIIGDGKKWKDRPGRSIWRVGMECKKEKTEAAKAAIELKKLGDLLIDKADRELCAKAAKLLSD